MMVKVYLPFYRITTDAIEVSRVLMARQDYMRVLFPD